MTEAIRDILGTAHTIAVVGLSPNPERPSHGIAAYLQAQGYRIIPVNPTVEEVLGEKSFPNLLALREPIDVVQIFRRPEAVPAIVEQAIQAGAQVVWMQDGIVHHEAAERALGAGLQVVMDHCMRREHRQLLEQPE